MKTVEFWFEFASTYSYLSAMRIDAAAEAEGVTTRWRPFLLGPIFKSFGWETSPFLIHPQKGAYMWRDVERRAERLGLPFHRPDLEKGGLFPQNGLAAARIAMVGLEADWGRDFCRSVYRAQFAEGRDISNWDVLSDLARSAGAADLDLEMSMDKANKAALRAQTERAMEQGIFGAPSFIVEDELFWGDDRLEDAVAWAAEGR